MDHQHLHLTAAAGRHAWQQDAEADASSIDMHTKLIGRKQSHSVTELC